MNKIKEVKELTNIIDVANLLGLNLNRAHFCKCPFHTENTASLSVSEKNKFGNVLAVEKVEMQLI